MNSVQENFSNSDRAARALDFGIGGFAWDGCGMDGCGAMDSSVWLARVSRARQLLGCSLGGCWRTIISSGKIIRSSLPCGVISRSLRVLPLPPYVPLLVFYWDSDNSRMSEPHRLPKDYESYVRGTAQNGTFYNPWGACIHTHKVLDGRYQNS